MPRLPQVVFQHFRAPQHEGPLPGVTTSGRVEGRKEGSLLQLHLRVDKQERVEQARWEIRGDRGCVAGMSLLTTYLQGREMTELEQLILPEVARFYELHQEQYPMLVPPYECLQDALASWRGQPSPYANEGVVVCHCLHVRQGRILRAIREHGLEDVDGIRFWTRACSGCRSCRIDLQDLLAREKGPKRP